ncbi:hypothetical protein ACGFZJ_34705 [Streptomyces sp. NPDC048253]|uniref:hypothetical protein n=1 Tax=Streptomyces sp. NPDC048253 TaxID=3365524 RepID=UPI0037238270
MAMLYGAADEVAGLIAVAEGEIGHPAFQVGWCAGAQGETFADSQARNLSAAVT